MVITTTGAAALAAGGAIASVAPADRPRRSSCSRSLRGQRWSLAGVARLGRYTRFVSHSVMVGFLSGVAVNIVLGQIPDLTGAEATGTLAIQKAASVILHPARIDVPTLLTGLGAMAILVLLRRTRLSKVERAPGADRAHGDRGGARRGPRDRGRRRGDPHGHPAACAPESAALLDRPAAGRALGRGHRARAGRGRQRVGAQPGRQARHQNRDFIAQGVGNVASGLFQGQPVGGSVGRTALNVAVGARSRWAAIASGVWMIVILVAFSGLIGKVAMTTLAGLLIVAAVGSLRAAEMRTILRTGPISQVALITTFVATLVLPIPAAVGIGVALSLLLQLNQEAMDLTVVELVPLPDNHFEERPAPASLPSGRITLLDAYGSLLYAGAKTLERRLPEPGDADAPVVVLRLRGRTTLGSTFFTVADDYAARLHARGGRLYLSGVSHELAEQMRAARVVGHAGLHIVEATPVIGESSLEAYHRAAAWLAAR